MLYNLSKSSFLLLGMLSHVERQLVTLRVEEPLGHGHLGRLEVGLHLRRQNGHLLLPHLRDGRGRPQAGVQRLVLDGRKARGHADAAALADAGAGAVVVLLVRAQRRAGLAGVGALVAAAKRRQWRLVLVIISICH